MMLAKATLSKFEICPDTAQVGLILGAIDVGGIY